MVDYVSIRKIFNDQKCALISKEPLDFNALEYICCCGTEEIMTIVEFQTKGHCDSCTGPGSRKKLTYAFVKQQFEIYGCEMISTEYDNSHSNLEFKCVCGKISKMTYMGFLQSSVKKCITCSKKQAGNTQRHDYTFIKQQFNIYGCTLLSEEYVSCDSKLEFICKCKRIGTTTYYIFIKSQYKQCSMCSYEQSADNQRIDYDFIFNEFKKGNCILLSQIYISNDIPLEYICECGLSSKISYSAFKQGSRCKDCGNLKRKNAMKHDYNDIKNYFEQNGCILLSETYINCKSPLKYICICGNESTINYKSFKCGDRCGCIKSYGETKLIDTLNALQIKYTTQHTYPDCKNIRCLPFDFYVNNKFIIEFDGEQHFKSVKLFGGETKFRKRIEYDHIKNMYCIKKNIPILRISYLELDEIPFIIDIYVTLIDKNIAPPIMLTNKKLYQNMKNKITEIPKEHWFLEI